VSANFRSVSDWSSGEFANFVELRKATTAEGAIEEIGVARVRIRAHAGIS
jgi:hypothetical protein